MATFTESKHVYVVDDDPTVLESTAFLLTNVGYEVRCFPSGAEFLAARPSLRPGAVLLDLRMPDVDGLSVIADSDEEARALHPMIMMTGHGDLPTAVQAMKTGAVDFLEKPFSEETLLKSLDQALGKITASVEREMRRQQSRRAIDMLTEREREVLGLLASGMSNKHAATHLGISFRTVEMHRAHMFQRLGVKTLADAVKLAMHAGMEF